MRSRVRRAAFAVVACLLGAACLASCARAGDQDCGDLAWMNTMGVLVRGDTSAVAGVRVCGGDECVSTIPRDVWRPSVREGDVWRLSLGTWAPESLTVSLLSDSGEEISSTVVTPRWQQIGGGEECGGPESAEVVVSVE